LAGTQIAGSTFTETDARIMREIWEGPRGHDGRFLWWGPTRGTDLTTLADTGGTPLMGRPCTEGLDWFRYFVVLDPDWDWRTLTRDEFQLLFEQSVQMHAGTYGGDDPDLSGFRNHNGRLLIVHGLADQYVPPQASIAYYARVVERMGGRQPTAEFARLFLVPGADHGFSVTVPTPSPGEMIGALIRWVEQDQPPAQLIADQPDRKGQTIRTRALTPYR
jgi:pimeloyl-ACP methyl ester carboxylesterase